MGTQGQTVSEYFYVSDVCDTSFLASLQAQQLGTYFVSELCDTIYSKDRKYISAVVASYVYMVSRPKGIRFLSSATCHATLDGQEGNFCHPCIGIILHRVMRMTRLNWWWQPNLHGEMEAVNMLPQQTRLNS
jgi:hypothetical protein